VSVSNLTIVIARPVEDVFAVLTNVENAATWSRAVEEKMTTPGPFGVGSRRRAVVPLFGGRTTQNEMELTEFEPNQRLAMRGVSGFAFPVRVSIDFERVETGTRLEWTTYLEPRGLLKVIGPALVTAFERSFRKDLAKLKAMMEAGEL
jgi:uncharacterized protein YndB with AHSA1/START domain